MPKTTAKKRVPQKKTIKKRPVRKGSNYDVVYARLMELKREMEENAKR